MDEQKREALIARRDELRAKAAGGNDVSQAQKAALIARRDELRAKSRGEELPKKPSRTFGQSALRTAGRIGKMTAEGLAGFADIPNLAALGLHSAGLKESPTFYEPVSSRVGDWANEKFKEYTGDTLTPEDKFEEYQDIIGQGLAPMALAPFTGGASLTASAAKGLAKRGLAKKMASKIAEKGTNPYALTGSNIAGSVGSSAGLKAYLDEYQDPGILGSLLASTAGGMGGRSAASLARNPKNTIAYAVGKSTGFSPEKYEREAALGLPVTPANVANGQMPRYLEMVAAKTPGSMGPLEDFYKKREMALARNIGIENPEDLTNVVKDPALHLAKQGAKGYHKRASDIYGKRSSNFEPLEAQQIANKELVDISSMVNHLEHERSQFVDPRNFDSSENGILLKQLKRSMPIKDFSKSTLERADLKKKGFSQELIDRLVPESLPETGIGLKDLNKFREDALQEAIAKRTPLGGSTPASREATMRSELLSKTRHENMEKLGHAKISDHPLEQRTGAHEAREARKFWAKYRSEEKGTSKYVEEVKGSTTDKEAFSKLKRDEGFFNVVRQGIPKSQQPKLLEAFMANIGERQGRFNIATAHTSWSNLSAPIKKEALKSFPSKTARENFTGTMDLIGENKKAIESLANTSHTAHTNQLIDLLKKYGGATAGVVTGAGVGAFVPLAVTYVGSKVGAKMWTDQKFLKRINDVMKANTPKEQGRYIKLLIKSADNVSRTGRSASEIDKAHKKHKAKITMYNTSTGKAPWEN